MNEIASPLDTAADWVDRLGELTPAEQMDLDAWIAASSENAAAFDLMHRTLLEPALLNAAERSRGRAQPEPVARPASAASKTKRWRIPFRVNAWTDWAWAACAGGGVLARLSLFFAPSEPQPPVAATTYATPVGARSDIRLADASVLHLNADSQVTVSYSAHLRALRLDHGEAMFEVAHNPQRPFDVSVGSSVVRAVGTIFDVDRLDHALEVKVFDGVVRVSQPDGAVRLVHKGEWLTLDDRAGASNGQFQPDLAQTWRSDWLPADNMPLPDVVERLNRYTPEKIVVQTPALSGARITGRFDIRQTRKTLQMLSAALDMTVSEQHGRFCLTRRPQP